MKIKTAELKLAQLNWAVAVCEGRNLIFRHAFMRLKAVENNYSDAAGLAFQLNNQSNCILDISEIPDNSTTGHGSEVHLDEIAYSSDWSQGGPIIERESMTIAPSLGWNCVHTNFIPDKNGGRSHPIMMRGKTILEAAMRCYVASKIGDEVEIPNELV